ncbi:histidine kinase [Actinomadura scrupuli]|uniref:sensor histidine kinase n=1 Tax=Actinomadura scrupuli TaxID=559629 RepID=UPI003D97305C
MRTVVTADRAARTAWIRTRAPYALLYGLALVAITAAYWAVAAVTEPLAPAATHAGGLAGAFAAGAAVHSLRNRLRSLLRDRRSRADGGRSPANDHAGPLAHGEAPAQGEPPAEGGSPPLADPAPLADAGAQADPAPQAGAVPREAPAHEAPGAAEALVTAITTVRETLGVPGAAVEAGGETYASGEIGERPHLVPLVRHGEPVGQMLIGRTVVPGQRIDERLLGMLTLHLADVTHAVRLSTDLQRSRERILSTREEERRRLRRDLHDGLGPTLASLAMSLDAARITLVKTPERVEPLLAELRERMATAIGDIRELVYDLRPPALDDLGLEGAIRSLAGGACTGPQVEVAFEGDPSDLPAAVEVAAYRIVQEALTNIRRHANSATALVRMRRAEELRIVVADDGAGLPPLLRLGGGLTSMRERAAELGGICVIAPRAGGGTTVTARLPLTREPERCGGRTEQRPSESAR